MTTMRKTLLALSLVLAPSLFAQTADMRILSASPSVTPTATGVSLAIFARWRNDGPDAAHFVKVTVSGTPTPFYVISAATTGWPCYASPDGNLYTCEQAEVAPGGEAELVLTMLTPATPGPFVIRVEVHAAEQDSQPENNIVLISSVLQAAPSGDLSISPTSQLFRANEADDVSVPLVIANGGPNPVRNITALLSLPFFANAVPPMVASGTGWVCIHPPYGPQAVLCSRSSLAAGEVAPITVTTAAPVNGGTFTINARISGEDYSDPSPANNAATATVTSAAEVESWTRILLPLIGPDVHGANGALWRTQVTALIASDTEIEIEPLACPSILICPNLAMPLRVPFDVYERQLAGFLPGGPGQFVYLHMSDEAKLHLNARVYDVSRTLETAGSEIRIVREKDFTSDTISLLGIPVASQYRHTLRVYDLDARDGTQVAIRIYANAETTPRLSVTRTLTVPQPAQTTIQDLPVQPGTIQLEIGQLLPLAGIETLRVDIEPLDAGLRLWSFVSVTNNDTHHVTTFSSR